MNYSKSVGMVFNNFILVYLTFRVASLFRGGPLRVVNVYIMAGRIIALKIFSYDNRRVSLKLSLSNLCIIFVYGTIKFGKINLDILFSL